MNIKDATKVSRAWAVFVLSHQSMFADLSGTWKISKDRNTATQFNNKKHMFDEIYVKRLENTSVFCRDAIRVIKATDTGKTFHYVDPPYFNSDMGHYAGYTEHDFIVLLDQLRCVGGKFLLSSYPSPVLNKYVKQNGWLKFEIDKCKSAGFGSRKTECLTMNYIPTDVQLAEAFIL